MGFVLPISSMAALLAIFPNTASWASITCHCRTMPSWEGNWVLIDTHLHLFLELQNIKLTEIWGSLSNRVTGSAPASVTLRSKYPGQLERQPACGDGLHPQPAQHRRRRACHGRSEEHTSEL